MAAGGGTHDANPRRIESLLPGEDPGQAHRAGGIVQHRRMTVTIGTDPIVEHVGRDPVFSEPACVTLAFMRGEEAITATRKDHDTCARPLNERGVKRGEARNVAGPVAECARGASGPEPMQGRVGHGTKASGGPGARQGAAAPVKNSEPGTLRSRVQSGGGRSPRALSRRHNIGRSRFRGLCAPRRHSTRHALISVSWRDRPGRFRLGFIE
jgi:hypothetical protein